MTPLEDFHAVAQILTFLGYSLLGTFLAWFVVCPVYNKIFKRKEPPLECPRTQDDKVHDRRRLAAAAALGLWYGYYRVEEEIHEMYRRRAKMARGEDPDSN